MASRGGKYLNVIILVMAFFMLVSIHMGSLKGLMPSFASNATSSNSDLEAKVTKLLEKLSQVKLFDASELKSAENPHPPPNKLVQYLDKQKEGYQEQLAREEAQPKPMTAVVKVEPKPGTFAAVLCSEDKDRFNELMALRPNVDSILTIKPLFYKSLMHPLQTACNDIKRIGTGVWDNRKAWDGHKYVCMDDFHPNEPCLVYSFGLNKDLSFETSMAKRGCEVYAYDHTIPPVRRVQANLHVFYVGVSNVDQPGGKLKTLKTLIKENGHEDRVIQYLKADVDGAETAAVPQWFSSGALKNVKQVALEFHDVPNARLIHQYLKITQDFYRDGFKTIMWDPNMTTNPAADVYRYYEIVFRRADLCAMKA